MLPLLLILACGPKKNTTANETGVADGGNTDGGDTDGGDTDGGDTDGGGVGDRLTGTIDVADATLLFVGEPDSELGSSLAAGSLGSGGERLIALGAVAVDGGAGAVGLYDLAGALVGTVGGRAAEDSAGSALAIEDVDGDGQADLLVGARRSDLSGDNAGSVSVLLGPIGGDVALVDADATWTGEVAGDYAGGVVLVIDGDGDGDPDLLVGAGQADTIGSNSGAVYLLDDATVGGVLTLDSALARVDGPEASLGGTAMAAGDLDGDGLPEVVLGGFGYDGVIGGAWVAQGPVEGQVSLDTDALAWLVGRATYDLAGQAVAVADLDGDGTGELVISIPGDDTADAEAGLVLVYEAPDGELTVAGADGILLGAAYARAGWALALAGDVDGDGASDLLVGCPGDDDSAGAAFLVYGPVNTLRSLDRTLDLRFEGAGVGAGLGDAVAAADLGGGGRPALLLGAPAHSSAWLWDVADIDEDAVEAGAREVTD